MRLELEDRTPGAKIRIYVGKCRAILAKVTVEGGGEALEGDPEVLVEALEDGDGDRPLVLGALSRRNPVVAVVPLDQHPDSAQKVLELTVVRATVPVKLFLKFKGMPGEAGFFVRF